MKDAFGYVRGAAGSDSNPNFDRNALLLLLLLTLAHSQNIENSNVAHVATQLVTGGPTISVMGVFYEYF